MQSPIERMVKVLNDRRNERSTKELLRSDPSTPRQDSMVRRMAKRIARGAGQRCFDSGEECVVL